MLSSYVSNKVITESQIPIQRFDSNTVQAGMWYTSCQDLLVCNGSTAIVQMSGICNDTAEGL